MKCAIRVIPGWQSELCKSYNVFAFTAAQNILVNVSAPLLSLPGR